MQAELKSGKLYLTPDDKSEAAVLMIMSGANWYGHQTPGSYIMVPEHRIRNNEREGRFSGENGLDNGGMYDD